MVFPSVEILKNANFDNVIVIIYYTNTVFPDIRKIFLIAIIIMCILFEDPYDD